MLGYGLGLFGLDIVELGGGLAAVAHLIGLWWHNHPYYYTRNTERGALIKDSEQP